MFLLKEIPFKISSAKRQTFCSDINMFIVLGVGRCPDCQNWIFCSPHRKTSAGLINSLAPGRSGYDFKNLIFNLVLLIGILRSLYDNALRWMPQNITDDKSTLVQVKAWCRQAASHYLSQCWPRSMSQYDDRRPQWVKFLWQWLGKFGQTWSITLVEFHNEHIEAGTKWQPFCRKQFWEVIFFNAKGLS